MSVFETLYLLYKADTTDLKRGSEEVNQSTKKFDGSLKEVNKTLDHMGQKFGRLATQFGSMIAAFASIHAILSGIRSTISYDFNIGQQSRITGIRPEDLDAWSNAITQAGGTAEGFQGSIKSLAEHFHTTAAVAMQALPQLADVFSKISRYAAFNYGRAIGLDEPTILLLQQGRREVEALLKRQIELGVVTKQDADAIYKFKQETGNLTHSLRTLFNAVIVPLIPSLNELFVSIENGFLFLASHRDLVIGALIGIGVAAFGAAIGFGLITGEAVILSTAIAVLIAAFALLWEDVQVFLNGGKSGIGLLIDKWNSFIDSIGLSKLEITKNKDTWIEWAKAVKGAIKDVFNEIYNLANPLHLITGLLDKNKSIDVGGIDINPASLGQNAASKFFKSASSAPINNKPSLGSFYNSSYNKNFTINSMPIEIVTQATDAVGIASSLSLTLPDHFKHANNFFADGNAYG